MLHIKLIAGLGNWGKKYTHTRHNVGFLVVDAFAAGLTTGMDPVWKEKFGAVVCEVGLNGERLSLVKPCGFMNQSGVAITELARFFNIQAHECVLVHDDIDLALGALRIKSGGGHGGHNGVRSVMECFGSGAMVRLKVGVGRPPAELAEKNRENPDFIAHWVLSEFVPAEKEIVRGLVTRATHALDVVCKQGVKAAQNEFNKSPEILGN